MGEKEPRQDELFPLSEIVEGALVPAEVAEALESDEARGRYTAARLKKKKPELFEAVKALLAAGLPHSDIARTCSLSFYTVVAVAELCATDIAVEKEKLSKKMFINSELMQGKILEAVNNLDVSEPTTANIYQLALSSSVLADKANLFSGGATARIKIDEDEYVDADEYARRYLRKKTAEASSDADFKEGE